MNNLNIFILVFLSFALISCGSSSSEEHGFPNLNSVNLGGNKKISDLTPLLEIESLKNIYLDEKVQGSTLDRLMREEGIEKLLENGVNVKLVR